MNLIPQLLRKHASREIALSQTLLLATLLGMFGATASAQTLRSNHQFEINRNALLHSTVSDIPVPGTANPWLADATTAIGGDTAPTESPVIVSLVDFNPGDELAFTAIGSVSFGGGTPTDPPDGDLTNYRSLYHLGDSANGGPENNIGGLNAPADALVGVFLGPDPSTSAPPTFLNFAPPPDGNVPNTVDYTTLAPQIAQPFFIGDGVTSSNVIQRVTVPNGATRLVLGSMDGAGWYNNSGGFAVTVSLAGAQSDSADISATLTAPASVNVGSNITYQFHVHNAGPNTATGVLVTFQPSAKESFVSATVPYTVQVGGPADGYYFINLPNLTSGASNNFTFVFKANQSGTISLAGGGGSSVLDPNTGNNGFVVSTNATGVTPPPPTTTLTVNGSGTPTSIPADSVISFVATQTFRSAGLVVRVQATNSQSSPIPENSWTYLNNGNSGQMVLDVSNNKYVLTTTGYPIGNGYSFRAIALAPSYADTKSDPVGRFNITSIKTHLPPVAFTMQSNTVPFTVGGGNPIHFGATISSAATGLALRVQSSSTPHNEGSWIDLNNGNSGRLSRLGSGYGLDSADYPAGTAVYFRVIAYASGYTDSISNVIGPFSLMHNTPPTVHITSPTATQLQFGQVFTFTATASDNDRVSSLALILDDSVVTRASGSPATVQIGPIVQGSHTLKATAIDNNGAYGYATPININVSAPVGSKAYRMIRSGSWQTASNWSPSGVPGAIDSADLGSFTATIASNAHITVATLTAGSITGPGTLTVTRNCTWTGGTLSTFTLEVPSGANCHTSTTALKTFDHMIVNNAGSMTIDVGSDGEVAGKKTTLNNSGTFEVLASGPALDLIGLLKFKALGNVNNTGHILLNGVEMDLTGTSAAEMGISNSVATTIANGLSQTTGSIDLGPSNHPATIVGNVTLNGGSLIGNGTIDGNLTNTAGFVSPGHSAGSIHVMGDYTQGANGKMLVEVGGNQPSAYDQLQVDGKATLGGSLTVRTMANYAYHSSDSIVPLSFGSKAGAFASTSANAHLTFGATGARASISGANPAITPMLNISTRMHVGTGGNVLIGGFIVTGTTAKDVIIRGLGPSLSAAGVHGVLANPTIELHDATHIIATNDNWKDTQRSAIEATTIPPKNDLESAIRRTLNPGSYSVILRGKADTTGVGLIEVYDLNSTNPSTLANISSRGEVLTGDNVMIGGLIIGGKDPAKVIVRAIGPSLARVGVTNALKDPVLELHDSNGNVITNDNWRSSQEADIIATTIPPTNDKEAAILAMLPPGNYTAIVRGNNEGTGVAVVEAYNLQ